MTNDIDIRLVGDEELLKALHNADYKTQHKVLKKIVRDVGNKTLVKPMRAAAPNRTGTLRKSIGVVAGKSKRNAVMFVTPRVTGKYEGYVANIFEHYDGGKREPGTDKYTGKKRKRPRTPHGIRRHSGVMTTKYKGFVEKTYDRHLKDAEDYFIKSVRTIWEREFKRARKKGLV